MRSVNFVSEPDVKLSEIIVNMSMSVNQVLEDPVAVSDCLWSSTLRHELANLMTIIRGCCELLEYPCGMEKKQLLDHIQGAVSRSHAILVSDKRRSDLKDKNVANAVSVGHGSGPAPWRTFERS